MQCPSCQAEVPPQATFCDFCRVALRLEGNRLVALFPDIRRGDLLTTYDLSKEAMPNHESRNFTWKDGTTMVPVHNGVMVSLTKTAISFTDTKVRLRDSCTRATFTTLDADTYCGIVARQEALGGANTQYQLEVSPEQRAARLVRYFFTPKTSGVAVLVPWTQDMRIAPNGYPNEVEMRCQGPTLQGWVNGSQILAVHDAAWGIGSNGPRVGRKTSDSPHPARIVCHGFDIRMVAA